MAWHGMAGGHGTTWHGGVLRAWLAWWWMDMVDKAV